MKLRSLVAVAVAVALVASLSVLGLAACQSAAPTAPAPGSSQVAPAGTVLPVDSNPIVNASSTLGPTIVKAAAEDIVDPATNTDITDRLQVTAHHDTASELTLFEIYYVMTDVTSSQSEAYYQELTEFTVAPGATSTLTFDGETGQGHFPENAFSIYRSSKNQMDFTIELNTPGVQVATATATKGSGVGDAAD
jgi:hypothetical protein